MVAPRKFWVLAIFLICMSATASAQGDTTSTTDSPPDTTESTSTTENPPDTTESTSTTDNPPDTTESTSTTDSPPDTTESTSTTDNPPDTTESTSTTDSPPDTTESTSTTDNPPDTTESTSTTDSPPDTTESTSTTDNPPDTTESTSTTDSPPDTTESTSTTDNPPDTTEEPSQASTTTEAPTEINKPDAVGENNGKTCLKASLAITVAVTYRKADNQNGTGEVQVPTSQYEAACKGQNFTLANKDLVLGPAIRYYWDVVVDSKASSKRNEVAVKFSDDGTSSQLASVKANIATVGDAFPDALSTDFATFELKFDDLGIVVDSGTSFKCLLADYVPVKTDDETGNTVKFDRVGFQVGDDLGDKDTFADGSTCGAAGIQVTLITLLFGLLLTSSRWTA